MLSRSDRPAGPGWVAARSLAPGWGAADLADLHGPGLGVTVCCPVYAWSW